MLLRSSSNVNMEFCVVGKKQFVVLDSEAKRSLYHIIEKIDYTENQMVSRASVPTNKQKIIF